MTWVTSCAYLIIFLAPNAVDRVFFLPQTNGTNIDLRIIIEVSINNRHIWSENFKMNQSIDFMLHILCVVIDLT